MAEPRAAVREAVTASRSGFRGELRIVDDRGKLAEEGARELARRASLAVAERGRFVLALAGGSTPKDLYLRLAASPDRDEFPWRVTRVFWGDERVVPPDHPDSNYRLAREALLEYVATPHSQIHRVMTELVEPESAARAYERTLSEALDLGPVDGDEIPRFDVALLGLGADGHTASLFPGTNAVAVRDRWAIAVHVARLGVDRVSLTVPVFNAARAAIFLVAGEDKADALVAASRPSVANEDFDACPARAIRPIDGDLLWIVDRAAASRLLP